MQLKINIKNKLLFYIFIYFIILELNYFVSNNIFAEELSRFDKDLCKLINDKKNFNNDSKIKKSIEKIKELLMNNANPSMQCDENGNTPLHIAIINNYPKDIFSLFLYHTKDMQLININKKNKAGDTPISLAILDGNEDLIKLLLNYKDINLNDINNNADSVLELLINNYKSAETGNLQRKIKDIIEQNILIKKNLDLNHQNKDGDTALHIAAKKGYTDLYDFLKSKGANPDIINYKDKKTAQQLRLLYTFLNNLCDIGDMENIEGFINAGQPNFVEDIKNHVIDLNNFYCKGSKYNFIQYIAYKGYYDLLKYLIDNLKKYINIDIKYYDKDTNKTLDLIDLAYKGYQEYNKNKDKEDIELTNKEKEYEDIITLLKKNSNNLKNKNIYPLKVKNKISFRELLEQFINFQSTMIYLNTYK